MPRYLLDTNIVSFLLKNHPSVVDHFKTVPRADMALSAIVEAELRYGAERLPPGARIHLLLPEFLRQAQILPWDSPCAEQYAELRVSLEARGQPMDVADTMIAAHALTLGLTLVTNDKAFTRIASLRVEDWTQGPQHP